jgi:hypothetical protein
LAAPGFTSNEAFSAGNTDSLSQIRRSQFDTDTNDGSEPYNFTLQIYIFLPNNFALQIYIFALYLGIKGVGWFGIGGALCLLHPADVSLRLRLVWWEELPLAARSVYRSLHRCPKEQGRSAGEAGKTGEDLLNIASLAGRVFRPQAARFRLKA